MTDTYGLVGLDEMMDAAERLGGGDPMPSAADLYAKMLLPAFRELECELHPWWWPKGSGRRLEDWSLTEEQVTGVGCDPQTVCNSLRLGPKKLVSAGNGYYPGFPGGVADHDDGQEIVWVLSSRPSDEAFPNQYGSTTKLFDVLRMAGLLDRAHVTDFVKFRGPGPDAFADKDLSRRLRDGRTLWEVSLDCLLEEYRLLPPCVVLVAGTKTQRWFDKWFQVLFSKGLSEEERRLLDDLRGKKRSVRSWMASVDQHTIASDWKLKVQQACQAEVTAQASDTRL